PASGALNSYGPRYTLGGRSQLPCGAGLGNDHSSPLSCQGFSSAFFPRFRLHRKLKRNRNCTANSENAAIVMNSLSPCCGFRNSYCDGSYSRRISPFIPRMCIGKKTRLYVMNVNQKCHLPI